MHTPPTDEQVEALIESHLDALYDALYALGATVEQVADAFLGADLSDEYMQWIESA